MSRTLALSTSLLLISFTLSAVTLSGTLQNPDGTGLNGYLQLALSQPAALSASGGCGGPVQVMPTYIVHIKVVNGSLQSPPAIFGNDCMVPGNTYYSVQTYDNNGNQLMNDKWQLTGSTVNVGTIVSSVTFGIVGNAGVVLTLPPSTQTVTQSGGTQLNVNNLTVTNGFTMSGVLICTTSTCTFTEANFVNGLTTGSTSNSTIYIGPGGNLWIRPFSGGDLNCTGIADGLFGVRTDASPTPQLQICIGGAMHHVSLN